MGYYNSDFDLLDQEIVSDPHYNLWQALLSHSGANALDEIVRQLVVRHRHLVTAVRADGVKCLAGASPLMRHAVYRGIE